MRLRTAGIAAVVAGVAAVAWYLGSPLFIRTTVNEAFPTAVAQSAVPSRSAATSAAAPSGPVTIATGELGYVDAIHNGKGTVLLIRTGDAVVNHPPTLFRPYIDAGAAALLFTRKILAVRLLKQSKSAHGSSLTGEGSP